MQFLTLIEEGCGEGTSLACCRDVVEDEFGPVGLVLELQLPTFEYEIHEVYSAGPGALLLAFQQALNMIAASGVAILQY